MQRPSRWLLLVCLLIPLSSCDEANAPEPPVAAPPAAPAPTAPPGKLASGTVTELQAGDVACYITLKPDQGDPVHEMADFDICEQTSLVGRKVSLTWEEANVLAAECQGDVDCGKSDKVWLISAVKIQ